MSDSGSYRTNQFYSLPASERKYLSSDANKSNPKFAWPGSSYKTLGADGTMKDVKLQRGYIRLLNQQKSDNADIASSLAAIDGYRCMFQFNPREIVRSVSMNMGTMNPMLQDPAQLSVPINGNSDFTFEMNFDRTVEMNRTLKMASGSLSPDERPGMRFSGDVNNIGVLADIRALDTVIGLGFTSQTATLYKIRAEIASKLQDAEDAAAGSETITEYEWDSADAQANISAFMSENVGNQAFLIPNPVRVMFSSLFQVDGFVTSVTTRYVRFNQFMVPIQAQVMVTMKALYLGFAREKTFLTYVLSNSSASDLSSPSATPSATPSVIGGTSEERQQLINVIGNSFDTLNFSVTNQNGYNAGGIYIPTPLYSTTLEVEPISNFSTDGYLNDDSHAQVPGFVGSSETWWRITFPNAWPDSSERKLKESFSQAVTGVSVTGITWRLSVEIKRKPMSDYEAGRAVSNSDFRYFVDAPSEASAARIAFEEGSNITLFSQTMQCAARTWEDFSNYQKTRFSNGITSGSYLSLNPDFVPSGWFGISGGARGKDGRKLAIKNGANSYISDSTWKASAPALLSGRCMVAEYTAFVVVTASNGAAISYSGTLHSFLVPGTEAAFPKGSIKLTRSA